MLLRISQLLAVSCLLVQSGSSSCPTECSCNHRSVVDCSRRGLSRAPLDLPVDTKVLNLSDNNINHLPPIAFEEASSLEVIDLSGNEISAVGARTFLSLPSLRTIRLQRNNIKCVHHDAFKGLRNLESLFLNWNKLETLPSGLLDGTRRLEDLELEGNPLRCDCHINWLMAWLQRAPSLSGGAECRKPAYLQGQKLTDINFEQLKCARNVDINECVSQPLWSCPSSCKCVDGIVDCRSRKLALIPSHFPDDSTEIRLEQNQITEIPPQAFAGYRRLRRIDLSNNEIRSIAPDAFRGLKSLTSLVLYGNRITALPSQVFNGLTSLQLLLMNSNKIQCLRRDTFKDLKSINLLSLYDNKIQSLENGTFIGLRNMQTLHLARNPFYCDCHLSWLVSWLDRNPVETSGARCEEPKRMHKKKLTSLKWEELSCAGGEDSSNFAHCPLNVDCPQECFCEGSIVDCSRRQLKDIPANIPTSTTKLLLNDNLITRIPALGLFNRLPNLKILDASRNMIDSIEEGAFEGATSIIEISLAENLISEVSNKLFYGLINLQTLSLYSNKISSVTPGAFDPLSKLSSLNLIANPFNCNCHIAWFADWLKAKGFTNGGPRCAYPDHLKARTIHSLPSHEFRCTSKNDIGCLGANYCPPECTCTGTIVRCSHAKLTEIPEGLPRETSELYLDVNDIQSINSDRLRHLKSLARLDLSNNKINVLPPSIFANLTRLATLIVSYNKLQCIQEDAFAGLKNLRILSLHGNDISTIPEKAFTHTTSITHLALGSNPFYCDCNLKWLSEWVKTDYIEPGIAKCAYPSPLKEKLLWTSPSDKFVCNEEIPSNILAKCDLCHTSPCQNGAACKPLPNRDYKCICAPGFYGKNCDSVIDACYGNPCVNGATCKVVEAGRFKCICPAGFEGVRCETNTDDCTSHLCENNSTCLDKIGEYECNCSQGFTGKYCEAKIPFCKKEFNPCDNEGKCVDHFTHYTCECKAGFSGENCTRNIDDCLNHMCQNGGTCLDGIDSYSCKCPQEFGGKFCEIEPMVAQLYPQTSPCQQHDCKHGICFQPPGSNNYICKCAPGYSGKRCEYLTSLSFIHNTSYVEMESLNVKPKANITVIFATEQQNGVLLYTGDNQHLAVELFRGRIRVSYDVGNYPVSTMFSYELLSDGKYHRVELLAIKKNFTLRVDGGIARSIVNEGDNEYLDIRNSLFIAGVPGDVGQKSLKQWHLRNSTSFKGCIKEVYVNDKLSDFLQAAKVRHKVTPGCSLYQDEQPTDPCVGHKCQHGGSCRSKNDGTSYECVCKPNFTGHFCQTRASKSQRDREHRRKKDRSRRKNSKKCRKQKYNDYFIQKDGCRSKRPYKMVKCLGDESTCGPTKVKRRKIKFVCPDGGKYRKEVEIVRRCGHRKSSKWG
eukprot:TRINITY_DN6421_c0_g1_i2.p1 TRINITY_DN6421_c0_g1~~TRINITY_DN6421_c0_g1_i2.p1  ORF type:complete len:1396 (-),score=344.95 TRINITY_DN6421_c0_g1_i2:865-5052(-)